MSSPTRRFIVLLVGLVLFLGIPMLLWGLGHIPGFFKHPARAGFVAITVAAQVLSVLYVQEPGSRRDNNNYNTGSRRVLLFLIQIFSIAIVIVAPYSDARGIAVINNHDLLRYVGLVLYTLGFLLMIWAEATLGRQFSIKVTLQDNHQLVTGGPFRVLRHPRYLGIILFGMGIAFIFNALPALICSLALSLVLLLRIRDEESLLQQQFGPQWDRYRQHSWKLLPLIY